MAQKRWVDSRVDGLCKGLNDRGLFINRDAAAALLNDRVDAVAAALQISKAAARRYITAEAIDDLAGTFANMLADEQPGVDLMSQPRDTAIPFEILGRATAGLAEAVQVYLQLDGTEFNRDMALALAQAISLLGQLTSDSVGPSAYASEGPPELVVAFRRDGNAPARLDDLGQHSAQMRALHREFGPPVWWVNWVLHMRVERDRRSVSQ